MKAFFQKYKSIICLVLILTAVTVTKRINEDVMVEVFGPKPQTLATVVLDAGHGGVDPGKVGVAGTLEKELNLEIVYRVKRLLEQNNVCVVLTRESDAGLYTETDSNKKSADMRKRIEIINEEAPALVVSIHQNSYTSPSCKGAQVFYYENSETGKALAELLQNVIKETLADGNTREAKANSSYYMLKKSVYTSVIVECGFLSNPEEEALLLTEEYQEKIAWAIHLGILQYLNAE